MKRRTRVPERTREELEAELEAMKAERDQYAMAAHELARDKEKLLVLDDYRLQVIAALQKPSAERHESPEHVASRES